MAHEDKGTTKIGFRLPLGFKLDHYPQIGGPRSLLQRPLPGDQQGDRIQCPGPATNHDG